MKSKQNQETINNLRRFAYVYDVLKKRAHSLNNLYCTACNGELTKRQETKIKNLQDNAETLASSIGMKVYHQTDPRGASIYLIDKTMNASNYTDGICIW